MRSVFLDIQKIIDEQGLKRNELESAIAYNGTKPIGFTCASLARDNSDRFHVAKITY
ncbi:MAG: hypothetical protein HWQ38_27045 [Nostoc sp. NMS7]|uniref:hypothetical protein n=1 Tax=Nostoc sp. NMS7 TaxID=2815391 RepID=UPI002600A889|nr:hypothetical protein [Nostoc sp. NMS7]MBN3949929.1 hypothetical protein [Nostoc sp. NMS7]